MQTARRRMASASGSGCCPQQLAKRRGRDRGQLDAHHGPQANCTWTTSRGAPGKGRGARGAAQGGRLHSPGVASGRRLRGLAAGKGQQEKELGGGEKQDSEPSGQPEKHMGKPGEGPSLQMHRRLRVRGRTYPSYPLCESKMQRKLQATEGSVFCPLVMTPNGSAIEQAVCARRPIAVPRWLPRARRRPSSLGAKAAQNYPHWTPATKPALPPIRRASASASGQPQPLRFSSGTAPTRRAEALPCELTAARSPLARDRLPRPFVTPSLA